MIKKLLLILLVVLGLGLIATAVGLYLLYSNRNEILRSGTEKALTFVLQVDATVAGANLDLGKGSLELTGLNIPNPKGYNSDHAIKFESLFVEVDKDSLFGDGVKVVNLVELKGASINLEKSGASSNLQDLLASSSRFSSGKEAPPAENEPAGTKMRINKVIIDGTEVGVSLPLVNTPVGVKIPTIELTDVGNDKEPVTPVEAVQEIIATILAKITEFGNGILPLDFLQDITGDLKALPTELLTDLNSQLSGGLSGLESGLKDVTGELGNTANELTNTAKDTAKEATEGVEKAADEAKKAADEVGGALKGLLGGSKKEQ
ncbi:MAG: hypothetical protein SFY68_01170 [Candidatus Sumerlaeia bacterium]|nr:hypothetical protein [Candidatus Sumerlaeia bacterium]